MDATKMKMMALASACPGHSLRPVRNGSRASLGSSFAGGIQEALGLEREGLGEPVGVQMYSAQERGDLRAARDLVAGHGQVPRGGVRLAQRENVAAPVGLHQHGLQERHARAVGVRGQPLVADDQVDLLLRALLYVLACAQEADEPLERGRRRLAARQQDVQRGVRQVLFAQQQRPRRLRLQVRPHKVSGRLVGVDGDAASLGQRPAPAVARRAGPVPAVGPAAAA